MSSLIKHAGMYSLASVLARNSRIYRDKFDDLETVRKLEQLIPGPGPRPGAGAGSSPGARPGNRSWKQ
jgi:hypothetical protein